MQNNVITCFDYDDGAKNIYLDELDSLELVDCEIMHGTYGFEFPCENGHVTKVMCGVCGNDIS